MYEKLIGKTVRIILSVCEANYVDRTIKGVVLNDEVDFLVLNVKDNVMLVRKNFIATIEII
jgi:RNase P/RNase MRP subunit p29